MPRELTIASDLPAPPATVWARVASFAGINHELGPWLRMTAPRGTVLRPEDVPLGRPWFRSWLLVGGVLPIDYDHLTVLRLEEPGGFLERSTMLSARVWEHERTLEPLDGGAGTRLTDRVAWTPRAAVLGPTLGLFVPRTFAHRHRRLRRHFGGVASLP